MNQEIVNLFSPQVQQQNFDQIRIWHREPGENSVLVVRGDQEA